MKFLAKSLKVSNLLRKELMLRWSIANLFIFFNFKWWRIFSGLSLKFWFSDCFLNSFEKLFWNFEKKMYMCLLGVTVTDETKFFARKLSLNSQKLLILLIIFMIPSFNKMQTFFAEIFFANITITDDIEFGEVQMII